MKHIKTFEKRNNYYIYSKRFNDYNDGVMKNLDILDDNKIDYDIYIMTQNQHDFIIIYVYTSHLFSKILVDNNFHYAPTLTSLYGKMKLDEIKNQIEIGNFDPEGNSWKPISKETLFFKCQTSKFNL